MAGTGATLAGVWMELPRFDVDSQPICFKCLLAGHIAQQCRMGATTRREAPGLRMAVSQDRSAQVTEQQGDFLPLWQ